MWISKKRLHEMLDGSHQVGFDFGFKIGFNIGVSRGMAKAYERLAEQKNITAVDLSIQTILNSMEGVRYVKHKHQ